MKSIIWTELSLLKENKMEKKEIKIIFFGTSDFAKDILKAIAGEKYQVLAVFTQPDKKIGRKQEIKIGSVKEFADKQKIPVFQPKKLDEEMIEKVKELNPDLIIVAAYGKIIPKEILEIPKYKSINVHPSMLPEFRGPSPIQNAILAGKKETGISIMLMDEKMDHGDILAQTKVEIHPDENAEDLMKKTAPLSAKLLLETIHGWLERKIKPQKQDDSKATYCQLIEREDGHIFWNEEATEIYNKFRAFYPWPGIFSVWEKDRSIIRLKLVKIRIQVKDPEEKREIGEVLKLNKDEIGVKTAKGIIILDEVQLEGKSPAKINEFLNGYSNFIGSKLK